MNFFEPLVMKSSDQKDPYRDIFQIKEETNSVLYRGSQYQQIVYARSRKGDSCWKVGQIFLLVFACLTILPVCLDPKSIKKLYQRIRTGEETKVVLIPKNLNPILNNIPEGQGEQKKPEAEVLTTSPVPESFSSTQIQKSLGPLKSNLKTHSGSSGKRVSFSKDVQVNILDYEYERKCPESIENDREDDEPLKEKKPTTIERIFTVLKPSTTSKSPIVPAVTGNSDATKETPKPKTAEIPQTKAQIEASKQSVVTTPTITKPDVSTKIVLKPKTAETPKAKAKVEPKPTPTPAVTIKPDVSTKPKPKTAEKPQTSQKQEPKPSVVTPPTAPVVKAKETKEVSKPKTAETSQTKVQEPKPSVVTPPTAPVVAVKAEITSNEPSKLESTQAPQLEISQTSITTGSEELKGTNQTETTATDKKEKKSKKGSVRQKFDSIRKKTKEKTKTFTGSITSALNTKKKDKKDPNDTETKNSES